MLKQCSDIAVGPPIVFVLYTCIIVPNHDYLVNIPFVMTYIGVRMTVRRVERRESKSENSYLQGTRATCIRGSLI